MKTTIITNILSMKEKALSHISTGTSEEAKRIIESLILLAVSAVISITLSRSYALGGFAYGLIMNDAYKVITIAAAVALSIASIYFRNKITSPTVRYIAEGAIAVLFGLAFPVLFMDKGIYDAPVYIIMFGLYYVSGLLVSQAFKHSIPFIAEILASAGIAGVTLFAISTFISLTDYGLAAGIIGIIGAALVNLITADSDADSRYPLYIIASVTIIAAIVGLIVMALCILVGMAMLYVLRLLYGPRRRYGKADPFWDLFHIWW